MKKIKIKSTEKNINEANEFIKQGYEVVLDFGKKTDVEKMENVLKYFDEEYGIEVNFRHAEIEEILESAVIGGVSGAGAGILYGLIFGGPIGVFALAGGILGTILGGLAPVINVKIYKYKGHTLLKLKKID